MSEPEMVTRNSLVIVLQSKVPPSLKSASQAPQVVFIGLCSLERLLASVSLQTRRKLNAGGKKDAAAEINEKNRSL
ncbi:hypothetical protein JOB18_006592 [Solea senegalensis]|uniref:Uncharacterized protein n=1 Tax=Solea senegalensis TaxID=28829 RepID=A0AAV6T415_SOLSE|nr:hypothetical protein JOB18_006592 [Solea senegalensis]